MEKNHISPPNFPSSSLVASLPASRLHSSNSEPCCYPPALLPPPPSSLPRHPKRRSKMLSSSLRLLSWRPADVIRVTLGAPMSERPSDLVIFQGADSRERERRRMRKRRSASVCPCVSFPSFVWRKSRSADAATTECKAINIYIRVEKAEAQLRNINTPQRSNLSRSLYFF